jgi:hypothetical protein
MIEPPYGVIGTALRQGEVVPFLGAGASLVGRPQEANWDSKAPKFLPSGDDLAHFLADQASFPSRDARDRDDLAKVASYYADISGRGTLRKSLRKALSGPYEAGPLHRFLASVPANLLIVVTNYDTLLEQAFRAAKKPYDLVVYPADRKDVANAVLWWPHGASEPYAVAANQLSIDLARTTVIFKMHGTVGDLAGQWDNFVITEEDYIEFLSRMTSNAAVPSLYFEHLAERSFLFLGYGLRDWNLRVVLKNLQKHLSGRRSDPEERIPSWAIQRSPSELDRILWDKRGVTIFDISINDFVRRLEAGE